METENVWENIQHPVSSAHPCVGGYTISISFVSPFHTSGGKWSVRKSFQVSSSRVCDPFLSLGPTQDSCQSKGELLHPCAPSYNSRHWFVSFGGEFCCHSILRSPSERSLTSSPLCPLPDLFSSLSTAFPNWIKPIISFLKRTGPLVSIIRH